MNRARVVVVGAALGLVAAGLAVLPAGAEPSPRPGWGAARAHVEQYAGNLGVARSDPTVTTTSPPITGTPS